MLCVSEILMVSLFDAGEAMRAEKEKVYVDDGGKNFLDP